ncbi:MAG TPA: hypothetical protein VGT99_14045 [Gammaproteobacteria bacterium]|nr:hypothetical protein [Gammaproteobacteria bacterium]
MKANDPLAALVASDAKAADRQQLAELLGPYVQIDSSTQEFRFLPAFTRLSTNDDKVEILLAAAKARALIFESTDGLLPKEVIDLGLMPLGSTKSAIKRLFDTRKIRKGKDGRYSVPNYRVPEIAAQYRSSGQGKPS